MPFHTQSERAKETAKKAADKRKAARKKKLKTKKKKTDVLTKSKGSVANILKTASKRKMPKR